MSLLTWFRSVWNSLRPNRPNRPPAGPSIPLMDDEDAGLVARVRTRLQPVCSVCPGLQRLAGLWEKPVGLVKKMGLWFSKTLTWINAIGTHPTDREEELRERLKILASACASIASILGAVTALEHLHGASFVVPASFMALCMLPAIAGFSFYFLRSFGYRVIH
ncbi:hypothetical protein V8C44DRAFT_358773 [Trichoderma aethiopicum]